MPGRFPALVDIDLDPDVRTDRFPHGRDPGDIEPRIGALSPTLSLTVSKPSRTCCWASAAICSGDLMLTTREIVRCGLLRPPSNAQSGNPAAFATRSWTAMSIAALAAGTASTRAFMARTIAFPISRIQSDHGRGEIVLEDGDGAVPGLAGHVRIGRRFAPAGLTVRRGDAHEHGRDVVLRWRRRRRTARAGRGESGRSRCGRLCSPMRVTVLAVVRSGRPRMRRRPATPGTNPRMTISSSKALWIASRRSNRQRMAASRYPPRYLVDIGRARGSGRDSRTARDGMAPARHILGGTGRDLAHQPRRDLRIGD